MNDLISVILPVYNGEQFIQEALESVLKQTYKNIEIIIIDDCSNDRTAEILRSYHDPRIVITRNQVNSGIVFSLNKGLKLASGTYIARMDADDICELSRFEKQLAFLDQHPDIAIVSVAFRIFGEDMQTSTVVVNPSDPDELKCRLIFSMPLLHPGWMIRKKDLVENGVLYDEEYRYCEDLELLRQITKVSKVSNMTECLMNYRVSDTQTSVVKREEQIEKAKKSQGKLIDALDLNWETKEKDIFYRGFNYQETVFSTYEMNLFFKLLIEFEKANLTKHIYSEKKLHSVFADIVYFLCAYNLANGERSGHLLLKNKYFFKQLTIVQRCKIILRSLLLQ